MGGGTLAVGNALPSSSTTSFVSRQINQSTFLIIEDDAYDEQPYIYVKVYPDQILITDTGCNNPRQRHLSITSLRHFIEDFPLSINQDQPLNRNGRKKYIIICSHCHYDHILGLPEFSSSNPTIVASSYDRDFLLHNLGRNSLCDYLKVPTPVYKISKWASHMEYYVSDNEPCRIQFLHIPGHTPDSLAWYDLDEHHLYVGDIFYERSRQRLIPELDGDERKPSTFGGVISFQNEGANWISYMDSLDTLLSFAVFRNEELKSQHGEDVESAPRVKVGCGHITHEADAEEVIREVKDLYQKIIAGKLPVHSTMVVRGAVNYFWLENDNARYSVMAPRRLVEEARKHFKVTSP